MYHKTWNAVFKDFREAKIIILEWEKERRGEYETEETWNDLISKMYAIEMTNNGDLDKIKLLMSEVGQIILHDATIFPKEWMLKEIKKTRHKINYYKNNPEEERESEQNDDKRDKNGKNNEKRI